MKWDDNKRNQGHGFNYQKLVKDEEQCCYKVIPVKTNLADASATSNAVLPSVFRMLGSAPC